MDKAGVATDARVATCAEASRPSDGESRQVRTPDAWSARDNWGPCCPDCSWWGESYKPCDVCLPKKEGRA